MDFYSEISGDCLHGSLSKIVYYLIEKCIHVAAIGTTDLKKPDVKISKCKHSKTLGFPKNNI